MSTSPACEVERAAELEAAFLIHLGVASSAAWYSIDQEALNDRRRKFLESYLVESAAAARGVSIHLFGAEQKAARRRARKAKNAT